MNQTSAFKPGPSSQAVNLDLHPLRPRPTSHEEMEVDYGPALPTRLGADHHYASDQHSGLSEEPSKKASDRPKKHSLTKGMILNRGLPQINTMMNSMNLRSHLLNPKNMLTGVNIR